MNVTQEQITENLIYPLWNLVSRTYKKKNLKNIWEQFENNLRSALYTSSLASFVTTFKSKLPCEDYSHDAQKILSIVGCGEDEEVMNNLRANLYVYVISCQILNQDKSEKYKAEFAERVKDALESYRLYTEKSAKIVLDICTENGFTPEQLVEKIFDNKIKITRENIENLFNHE